MHLRYEYNIEALFEFPHTSYKIYWSPNAATFTSTSQKFSSSLTFSPGMVIISLALGKEIESGISYLEIDVGRKLREICLTRSEQREDVKRQSLRTWSGKPENQRICTTVLKFRHESQNFQRSRHVLIRNSSG